MYEADILDQKRKIVKMVHDHKISAHISPAFAMMEALNVLLRDVMKIADGIDAESSDKLVLSNGHIALALYAVYETIGYITWEDFCTYKKKDSRFGVHQDRNHTPGAIISTGSLGHGLPNAVGIAYAWKLQGKTNRIFVTVGDGELNEGSIWEALIFAARMQLDNICVIVDDNKSTEYMPQIADKIKAFGWKTTEIDGHDEDSLREALLRTTIHVPYAVIINTVKGHGIDEIERNHGTWHEKTISDDDYDMIMEAFAYEPDNG